MYKLLYTDNIPFNMRDWKRKQIKEVFAGENCVMAVTKEGATLQKIADLDRSANTQYWTRIKQIGISKWLEGAAIGLVEDGTCLIAKKPIRCICKDRHLDFDHINNTVKAWTDVIQVQASDAFFALRADGTVDYVSFCERHQAEYETVKGWRDVVKIVTGVQNSVFGITKSGAVLTAGCNGNNVKSKLSLCDHVADLYPLGNECADAYVLKNDGGVEGVCASGMTMLDGNFAYKGYALTADHRVVDLSAANTPSVFPEKYKIVSFAVGSSNYSEPFVIAVAEVKSLFG